MTDNETIGPDDPRHPDLLLEHARRAWAEAYVPFSSIVEDQSGEARAAFIHCAIVARDLLSTIGLPREFRHQVKEWAFYLIYGSYTGGAAGEAADILAGRRDDTHPRPTSAEVDGLTISITHTRPFGPNDKWADLERAVLSAAATIKPRPNRKDAAKDLLGDNVSATGRFRVQFPPVTWRWDAPTHRFRPFHLPSEEPND
jgi:hypothetical protein